MEVGAHERWWWQCQRGSLERDRERETSGQIPAAEEHVKCEKLRQTVDLGRAVGRESDQGLCLTCDVSEVPQAGQAGSRGAGGPEATAESCEGAGRTRGLGAWGSLRDSVCEG